MTIIQDKAKVVIIGGGVIGCSVAYHLSKLGWSDVVLLERKQLTSGTTWHAAGLIGQLRASANMTKLAKYTQELYFDLEKETGVSTGFKRVGSISVALTNERMEEIIMTKANETNGIDKSNLVKVNEDQFIEEFLPQIVCTNANCEVVDKSGNVTGYITNKELQSSLTKS